MRIINKKNAIVWLLLALLILIGISLMIGSVPISDYLRDPIIWYIRLPRVMVAAMVGILLATSGVILQGVLRNPLADPYILGVSSGAGVGAAIALALKLGLSVPILAFLFALIAVMIVYSLSQVAGRTTTETLILAGVAVSSAAAAILSLIILVSGQLQSIYFWLLGSFSLSTYNDAFMLVPYVLIGLIISYFYSKELNSLLLGEEVAKTLGVEVEKIRMLMIVVATLMTAAAVSVSGLIGFVGLMIPHFIRLLIGPNYRALVPLSAISGALLLVLTDLIARTALSPMEIPIGVVMSLIGAPFFLYLLRRRMGA